MKKKSNQTICLNMIVKNEIKVIERCLKSLKSIIDYWVIVDTGSTDGTQKLIQECMRDTPGELIERPWVDFGHNRSEALELARTKADYVFTIDADEVVQLDAGFKWPELTHDSYLISFDDNGMSYQRCQLVKNSLNWRYEGVLHEYVHCPEAKAQSKILGLTIIRYLDGSRSSDPNKFEKDAAVLEKALLTEPGNTRYVFYLAQSYRDAGDIDSAILYYQKRASLGGWNQEIWYSLYQLGLLMCKRSDPWSHALTRFLRAYEYRPTRVEPLFWIMRYYRDDAHTAYLFGRQAITIAIPSDILFVERSIYTKFIPQLYADCCYRTGRYMEANEILVKHGVK